MADFANLTADPTLGIVHVGTGSQRRAKEIEKVFSSTDPLNPP